MIRAAVLLGMLMLSACAQGPGPRRERAPDGQRVLRGFDGETLERTASPSALVAEEIALGQSAQENGLWTALERYGADDAVMFVPGLVDAKPWLAARTQLAPGMRWQPHAVLMSCDGRSGSVTGAWQQTDGSFGRYTRIWYRPYTRNGQWEWVAFESAPLATPLAEPAFVRTKVAECRQGVPTVTGANARRQGYAQGLADDRTLIWEAQTKADGTRSVTVDLWNGRDYDRVLDDRLSPPQAAKAPF